MPETEQTFPPAPEVAARAHADRATYDAMYRASVDDPEGFWREHGRQLDWIRPYRDVKDTSFALGLGVDRVVSGRHAQRRGELRRPPPGRTGRPDRDHLRARRSRLGRGRRRAAHHVPPAPRPRLQVRQRPEGDGGRTWRPGGDLPADDPAGGLCDARLRADRGDPLGGLRGLLVGRAGRTDRRLRRDGRRDGRRGAARRPGHAAEGQRGRRGREGVRHACDARRQTHRRRGGDGRGTRPLAPRDGGRGRGGLPGRGDGRGGPALHPLHVRVDGPAEGRGPHHRRLPRLRGDDPPLHVRLP